MENVVIVVVPMVLRDGGDRHSVMVKVVMVMDNVVVVVVVVVVVGVKVMGEVHLVLVIVRRWR